MDENLKKQIEALYDQDSHEEIIVLLKKEFGDDFFAWDYEALGQYAAACNNLERYDEAIKILEMPSGKDESDWKWYYRKMYAHYGRATSQNTDEEVAKKDDEKTLLYTEHLLKLHENSAILDESTLDKIKYARYNTLLYVEGEDAANAFTKEYDYVPQINTAGEVVYYTEEEMDAVEKYYDTEFGKADNILHEIVSEVIHCDIVIVEPDEISKCYTLCTMGAGAIVMEAVTDEIKNDYGTLDRMELVIQLPSDWNIHGEDEKDYWPIRWLKHLARMPYSYNTFLDYWHTVPTSQPLEGTNFVCFMLAPPSTRGEGSVVFLPNGKEVAILQLIPLYKEEMDYKLEYGADALIDKLLEAFPEVEGEIDQVAVVTKDRKNACEGFVSTDDKFFVLSSYEWNFDEGEEIPPIKDNLDYLTKPCYFLKFCFENKLLYEGFEQIFAKETAKKGFFGQLFSKDSSSKSIPEFAAEFLEGNFTQDELNEVGISFAKSYYRSNMDISYVVEYEDLVFEKYGERNLIVPYDEKFYKEFVEPLLQKRFHKFIDYYYGEE